MFDQGMDPSFTRMIKLDILASLCIDPKAIDTVLKELSTYVRHSDKAFACAAIRSVGKVAELARVVYDRRAQTSEKLDAFSARADSNIIILNCLSGLVTLSEFSRKNEVVGECAEVIQHIFSQILSDDGSICLVNDPAGIQERALNRLLLILIRSLTPVAPGEANDDQEKIMKQNQLQSKTVHVPDSAVASALWVVGEWLSKKKNGKRNMLFEVLRLLAKSFGGLNPQVKLQAVHLASKVLLTLKLEKALSSDTTKKERAISEFILAMASMDVLQDVRDRARYEGNLIHMSVGLFYDTCVLQQPLSRATSVDVDTAKSMLLHSKPGASFLPLDSKDLSSAKIEADLCRFGTLSSIMCNRTMGCGVPLLPWAEVDSPSALRDPSTASKSELEVDGREPCLYSSSSDDESSESSSSSSYVSSSSSSDDSTEDSGDKSSADESMDSDEKESNVGVMLAPFNQSEAKLPSLSNNGASDGSSFGSSDDTSNSSNESEDSNESTEKNKINANTIFDMESADLSQVFIQHNEQKSLLSNVAAGLEDLVMTPLTNNKDDVNIDDESGVWRVLVRPELSGGLFVKMRFVHGRSKAKEARLLGLDHTNASTVCLQVHVENM